MKDYLKENLSKGEDDEIRGIIWKTAQKYKLNIYHRKKMKMECIDNIDGPVSDTYKIEENQLLNIEGGLHPFLEEEKLVLVNKLDNLLDDLELSGIKRTLTFGEKLVFVLVYVHKVSQSLAAKLLKVQRKTIYNRCKSIDKKVKGEIKKYGR
ncbi:MAG: hypothetical protein HFJ29_03180 [Clostridia bacterium]|nr:hypothetical protein [Clostridia bacterium]